MKNTIQLITPHPDDTRDEALNIVELPNDADPSAVSLQGVDRIDLHFPKFTDGRAYSQAYLLRRRLGFGGDIRANGDVLVDQLLQMQRSGFSSAVLRADQNLFHAERQLAHFANFYQGDATQTQPVFAPEEVSA
jgi:uncharacterized protein (DUF934 family)